MTNWKLENIDLLLRDMQILHLDDRITILWKCYNGKFQHGKWKFFYLYEK